MILHRSNRLFDFSYLYSKGALQNKRMFQILVILRSEATQNLARPRVFHFYAGRSPEILHFVQNDIRKSFYFATRPCFVVLVAGTPLSMVFVRFLMHTNILMHKILVVNPPFVHLYPAIHS